MAVPMGRREQGARLLYGILAYAIMFLSLVAFFKNQYDLSNTDGDCHRWNGTQCEDLVVGCLWTADTSYYTPCNYGFNVGAIGMFSGVFAVIAWDSWEDCRPSVAAAEWPVGVAMGCFNLVWYAVAGGYFTKAFLDNRSLPKDSSRRAVLGLMWACLGVACVQLIVAVAGLAMSRKRQESQELQLVQQQQQAVGTLSSGYSVLPGAPEDVPTPALKSPV